MFDITGLDAPVWGDKVTGSKFVTEALTLWSDALSSYSGKSETTTAKVGKVLDTIRDTDDEAVTLADEAMAEVRSLILEVVRQNVNTTYLLFSELDDLKKAIGSWRADANVTVENDENDEDRDLVSEYEALEQGRTMIEGTFNAFGLSVDALPAKFVGMKSERVEGKNVPTGERYLKFPGKLASPLNSGEASKAGKTATSMMFTWSLTDSLGENIIGKASFPYLARYCSTSDTILSTDDVITSIKAKHGDNFAGVATIEVRTPRGILTGTKVKK